MGSTAGGTSSYRVTRALLLRVGGPIVAVLGLAWVVVAVLDLSGGGRSVLLVMTVGVLAILGGLMARPPRLLDLSEDGFRVRLVRGVGASRAAWRDVESVETRTVRGAPSVVFSLSDGRVGVLPTALLGSRAIDAQRDIHARLNSAFGYRRLERD